MELAAAAAQVESVRTVLLQLVVMAVLVSRLPLLALP
jgi:hypothetical protein